MKYCLAIKEQFESLYFPEGKKNWHVLQIPKAHGDVRMYQESQQTRHTKQIAYKNLQFFWLLIIIPSCVLVILININIYILTR